MPPLDVKKTMEELQTMYVNSSGANKTNFLLYGDIDITTLSKRFQVSKQTIRAILKNDAWKQL